MVDDEISQLLQLAGLYEKGLPPVAGGVLDQSQWFIDAAAFAWREQAILKRATRRE